MVNDRGVKGHVQQCERFQSPAWVSTQIRLQSKLHGQTHERHRWRNHFLPPSAMTGAGTGWGLQPGGGISEPFAGQSKSGAVTTCLMLEQRSLQLRVCIFQSEKYNLWFFL